MFFTAKATWWTPSPRFSFDLGLPYLEESGLYFLRGNFLDVVAFGAEHFFPERNGGIQTLDCDAEMFDV